ncbi:hypothetical protein QBC40DRAFT_202700 [Triangularia verruculosa]|uniref:Microbial-type PARG catalytic domain-containing protein n=1 Tax=Triangularia verruculosa TaxID=2587418 RepID=A0AAN6XFC7_9PEZI|nr:hypothetical protein QBC40DRAFT_202700 [Triangularia verruculosa]
MPWEFPWKKYSPLKKWREGGSSLKKYDINRPVPPDPALNPGLVRRRKFGNARPEYEYNPPGRWNRPQAPVVGPRPMPITRYRKYAISKTSEDIYTKLLPGHLQPVPPPTYAQTMRDYSAPEEGYPGDLGPVPGLEPHMDPILRAHLRNIGQETRRVLPDILARLGTTAAAKECERVEYHNTHRLNPSSPPTRITDLKIRVVNMDTLDAALSLPVKPQPVRGSEGVEINWNPLILNFSDAHRAGDGWKVGDYSQSESLCYRTSLTMSLENGAYPITWNAALYSPYVLCVRGEREKITSFLDLDKPHTLPVVSCISVTSLHKPKIRRYEVLVGGIGPQRRPKEVFFWDPDRDKTKSTMRLALRIAATYRHPRLILGAQGCGNSDRNPPEDVAACWLEVLREDEFSVNWWTDVVFAVWDKPEVVAGQRNFEIFKKVLDGQHIGHDYWQHDDRILGE